MSQPYLVEPDVGFIQSVTALGGRDLKKCFQCATCSVACPISPDNKPFPRKEMIAAAWGLKEKLVGNADIWLCHNCGDCTTRCPRGAKPGEVLAAVRAYTISEYAVPKALARMVQQPGKLPLLLFLPVVIFLVMGGLSDLAGLNWLNLSPGGEHLWQSSFINNYLVDIIMIPTFTFSVVVFFLGLKRFMVAMHNNALAEGKTTVQTIDPMGFGKALIRVIPTIFKHRQFTACTENKARSTAHMMVLFSFIGLFIVTTCFFLAEWVLQIEGPYRQINPVKWLANASGVALVIGGFLLIKYRMAQTQNRYWDWALLGLVLILGLTGLLTEIARLAGFPGFSAIIYAVHLMFVWSLFAYTPFSKLAHLVYRTVAMTYAEYSGRK